MRLSDNPAFFHSIMNGKKLPTLPIYIHQQRGKNRDKEINIHSSDFFEELECYNNNWKANLEGEFENLGVANKWWLYHSLKDLNESLNGYLFLYIGDRLEIIKNISKYYDIDTIYYNICYDPFTLKQDEKLEEFCDQNNIKINKYHGSLLVSPRMIYKDDGNIYKVFSHFFKKLYLRSDEFNNITPNPLKDIKDIKELQNYLTKDDLSKLCKEIDDLELLSTCDWYKKLDKYWSVSEREADNKLNDFIDNVLEHYSEGRNIPSKPYTSFLSSYLRFGQISPRQIWKKARLKAKKQDENLMSFYKEIGWREFAYYHLYHNESMLYSNLQKNFDKIKWGYDKELFQNWCKGNTSVPIIDAGMRQLWETGYMHNRVRMLTSSFLTKNLKIDWRYGQIWFYHCLVDADLANNSFNWQWVAGCGYDAAPYFRVFNPILQAKKFDKDNIYINKYSNL